MSRALAYCGLLHGPNISLPQAGVNQAPVRAMALGGLCLLWSEVEWPFDPALMQRNAVEFHRVINHIFTQTAVVPFRLLSVFEDERALEAFIAMYQDDFIADLERLKNFVQMECVVYFGMPKYQADTSSGKAYLQQKAELLRMVAEYEKNVREALSDISREVRARELKSGSRIFVLVERGRENGFRGVIQEVAVPERLAQRISGPWPAAEFLSASVKAPQIDGVK